MTAGSGSLARVFFSGALLGALLCTSCAEPASERAAPVSARAPEGALRPRANTVELTREALTDERVWITTDRDSVELVQRVLGTAAPQRELSPGEGPSDEVALLVPHARLPEISEAQHEERHRCGGFMLHGSQAEALAMLRAPVADDHLFLLAPSYTLDNQATVEALLPEAKEPNVLATIRKLSSYKTRFHTSMTGEEAAQWIRDTWQMIGAGRDDIKVELVDHEKTPQPSIKMTIRGKSLPDEIVVLGGHMDSIVGRGSATSAAPGADDNASGIAVLTEIARAAVELDYRPERTVVFYGYAAEEIGLVGSAEIAARAKAEGLNVIGVMQVDMTNYTTASAPYIGLISDFTNPALTAFSAKLIEQYLKVPYRNFACGYGCSDHASWTKNGFASMSPHEADMNQGNDRIHTTGDTLALSKDSASHSMHFARFGLAFMAELAKGKLETMGVAPACSASKPCEAGQRCETGACVPAADAGPAAPGGSSPATPGACSASADCPAGQSCDSGRCTAAGLPTSECSDTVACSMGLTCTAGRCVSASGSQAKRDAGSGKPDAGARANSDDNPTSTDEDEATADEGDDDSPPPVAQRSAGCTVSTAGAAGPGAWLWGLAVAWLWGRRRQARRSTLPTSRLA